MTNLTELKKQYEALGKEIAKLEAEQEWPKVGDLYWYVDGCGQIGRDTWTGSVSDKARLAIGNCFRTHEEAEAERDARLVVAELKRQPGAKRFEVDKYNFCIRLDLQINEVQGDFYKCHPFGFGQAYFDSGESCRKAIAAVGEDRILKAARWWAMGSAE